jgi:hypothetical protein
MNGLRAPSASETLAMGEAMDRLIDALREFSTTLPATKDLLDLQAQQAMAFWAKWMTWATAASLVISVGGLIALLVSLSHTRRTIKDNRALGEYQTQAYVHAAKADFGKRGIILIWCKNTGASPASHFGIRGELRKVVYGSIEASTQSPINPDLPWKLWTAIGAEEELSVALNPGNSDLLTQFRQHEFAENEVLLVVGQVIYCTVFNHDHTSDFAFYVMPDGSNRFRRPTTNMKAFHRLHHRPAGLFQRLKFWQHHAKSAT